MRKFEILTIALLLVVTCNLVWAKPVATRQPKPTTKTAAKTKAKAKVKPAVQPLPRFVAGKGVWIPFLESFKNGDPHTIAAYVKSQGQNCIYPRYHAGIKRKIAKKTFDKLVRACHLYNIKVYAWGFVYKTNPVEQANLAIETLAMNADGYIWNAEQQFKGSGSGTAAIVLCSTVRSYVDKNRPKAILGYSTFCRVQNQQGIPFVVFDFYSDVAKPQVYWNWFRNWDEQSAALEMMNIWLKEQKKWKHTPRPIIPTLEASNGNCDMPYTPPKELKTVAKTFDGYYGMDFYAAHVMTTKHWQVAKSAPGSLDFQRKFNAKKAWADAFILKDAKVKEKAQKAAWDKVASDWKIAKAKREKEIKTLKHRKTKKVVHKSKTKKVKGHGRRHRR